MPVLPTPTMHIYRFFDSEDKKNYLEWVCLKALGAWGMGRGAWGLRHGGGFNAYLILLCRLGERTDFY